MTPVPGFVWFILPRTPGKTHELQKHDVLVIKGSRHQVQRDLAKSQLSGMYTRLSEACAWGTKDFLSFFRLFFPDYSHPRLRTLPRLSAAVLGSILLAALWSYSVAITSRNSDPQ